MSITDEPLEKPGYTEIPIDEVSPNVPLLVDLYIYLSDAKFVRIAKTKDVLSPERIQTYKDNKVTFFLIKTDDYQFFMDKKLDEAHETIGNPKVPFEQRQEQLMKIASEVFVEIENMDFDSKVFAHSTKLVNSSVSFCLSRPHLSLVLNQFLQLCSNSLYAHSIAVSTISTMIGIEQGWKRQSTLEKLALAGLLHDIGLKALNPNIRCKSPAVMNYEEKVEYESHPFLGMEILRALPEVPDDIVSVAFEHHEQGMGFGFPRHLKQFFINPYARVVGLANEFCNLTLPHLDPSPQKTPPEALRFIETILGQPYWAPAFKALQQLIDKTPKNK